MGSSKNMVSRENDKAAKTKMSELAEWIEQADRIITV